MFSCVVVSKRSHVACGTTQVELDASSAISTSGSESRIEFNANPFPSRDGKTTKRNHVAVSTTLHLMYLSRILTRC